MKFKTNFKKNVTKVALALPLLTLAACASYNASPLNSLSYMIKQKKVNSNNENVHAVAHALDAHECKIYLDRDVIAQGYQPVQIFIQNDSDNHYTFSPNQIDLPCSDQKQVADKVHTNTVGRAVGYGVGALFVWPLAIPAVVDGVKSSEANKQLDSDFYSKTAKTVTVGPHSSMNKLIFVPTSEYRSDFNITLLDMKSNESKTFQVSA
ncbi:MAG: hypothetical protein P0S95_00530 [Rhabdochlamydiaceae bacterium]|nr:hypothetical protein [Candidatus Amphrikana amoebophyrae]